MLLCVFHKLTVGFAVIGVINGIFVQETLKAAASDDNIMVRQKQKADEIHRKKMTSLFESLDKSRDGLPEWTEFKQTVSSQLSRPGSRRWVLIQMIYGHSSSSLMWMVTDKLRLKSSSKARGN